jgi:hypothetical protein
MSGMLLAGEKRSARREVCPGATLFAIFIKVISQLFFVIKRFAELNNSWVNETILLKVFMIG